MSLQDDGVLIAVVLTAVVVGTDLVGEGVHELAACRQGDVAGCVKGLGDAEDGFGGGEEGV